MEKSLSMEDVIKESLLSERDAEAFYREAEGIASCDRPKKMFHQLADDEAAHFGILRKRYLAMKLADADYIKKVKEMPPSIGLDELRKAMDKDIGERAALEIAMGNEKKAAARYRRGMGIADDESVKKMFEKLVDDEERHFVILSEEFSIVSGQPTESEVDTYVRE